MLHSLLSGRNAVWIGCVFAGCTFAWELTRDRSHVLLQHFRDLFFVTLEVRSHQPEYSMILDWVSEHPHAKRTHSLALTSSHPQLGMVSSDDATTLYTSTEENITLNYGVHLLDFRGNWVWIDRHIDRDRKDSFQVEPHEILTVTMRARHRGDLLCLIQEAKQNYAQRQHTRTELWIPEGDRWRRLCARQKRSLDTVILPQGVLEGVVADCTAFWSGQARYRDRGIPWRRGYLFHGPPGTGKSSLIYSLAGHYNMPVYLLNVHNQRLNDNTLLRLVNSVPERSMVVLEDLDVSITSFAKRDEESKGEESFSLGGLLNAIDGIAATEGRLLCVTTNHPERLPSALLRAGRVDRRVEFPLLTKEQARRMYLKYHGCTVGELEKCPREVVEGSDRIAMRIMEKSLSPAQLQNELLDGHAESDATV